MIGQKSGSIVNFSSAAAYMTPPLAAAYNTAKAGVLGFMRSAALGLAEHGIRVNAVLPGASTRMTDEIFGKWGMATRDVELAAQSRVADTKSETRTVAKGLGLTSDMAAGTWRDPANVAPFVVLLLSDRTAGISGEAFCVVGYQVTKLRGYSYGSTIRSEGPWNLDDLARQFEAKLAPEPGLVELPWPPP
jgi:NAD(P)-dependent dehydrogenase (short-subunit alcohol dehydrogenase family)